MISAGSSWRIGGALAIAAGCGRPEGLPSDGSYSEDGGSSAGEVTSTSTSTTSTTSRMTSADTSGDDPSTTADSVGFIQDPDGGNPNLECDIWDDDCPRGEKCMPWVNDGSGSWNATRCTPIARRPNEPGEPCTVVDSGTSGIDDCEAGAMCWDVDGATNMGVCVALCDGPQQNPSCPDPTAPCAYLGESAPFMLCLPYCDPLVQDCGDEFGCYPMEQGFYCAWDGSSDGGAAGDPCESLNGCDPGLFCASSGAIPGCRGQGCCSPFCDTSDEEPLCPAGLECVAWYEDGQAVPGFELVGGCMEGE